MAVRLYTYIVAHDTGFAPNPFWGVCTLANCKPTIRRTARTGDWIVGLSRKSDGHRMIYAMKIDEIIDYATYYRDKRFVAKRPDFSKQATIHKCGDNIYEPLAIGGFRQLRSTHSNGERENPKTKSRDLSGQNVLIGRKFYYFGADGPELPCNLDQLKPGRGHKCRFSQDTIESFVGFISRFKEGVHGQPSRWTEDDHSWRPREC